MDPISCVICSVEIKEENKFVCPKNACLIHQICMARLKQIKMRQNPRTETINCPVCINPIAVSIIMGEEPIEEIPDEVPEGYQLQVLQQIEEPSERRRRRLNECADRIQCLSPCLCPPLLYIGHATSHVAVILFGYGGAVLSIAVGLWWCKDRYRERQY